jgi:GT2 family glycosyltransferase
MVQSREAGASIIIPVFNRVAFTRQCLDRIARYTPDVPHEVIVVDNGSTDGTQSYFSQAATTAGLRYRRNDQNLGFAAANNLGARLAKYDHLLFLNNDTLPEPGWLIEMVRVAREDARVGVVGIKQLFPYTRTLYHCGIVFTRGPRPIHLYPYADADGVHVNKQREYQAVNGACLLIGAELFATCGGFDEGYVNGYEDIDLCLAVRKRGFKVVCCTSAHIYHYAQITEGRTADDEQNLARLISKWGDAVRVDEDDYFRQDAGDIAASTNRRTVPNTEPARENLDARESLQFSSPYWRGVRVSVIVPVADRTAFLLEQLAALEKQSVLADEFEVIVVDYGSGDEARRAILEQGFPYAVHYHQSREDPRAGAARNAAVAHAQGELVLFLGEDSIPDERLLEEHLRAHASAPDPRTAVAGEIGPCPLVGDHASLPEAGAPGAFVLSAPIRAGTGSRAIDATRLDIGNASFKRVFLADAMRSGVRVNPELTGAAFQGADLAVQLQPLGLRVEAWPDARAYLKTAEDFQSMASREYAAGRDAVTVFRTHPALDHDLDVKWIADAHAGVSRLAERPRLRQAIAEFDARTDDLLQSLVGSLDELVRAERESQTGAAEIGIDDRRLFGAVEAAVVLTKDVHRTRGKVRAWYSSDPDPEVALTAGPLMTATRKIEWLAAHAGGGSRARPSQETVSDLRARLSQLEQQIRTRPARGVYRSGRDALRRALIIAASRSRMKSRLRALDRAIEDRLRQRKNGTWLARYRAFRARVRPYFV